jgi:Glycosyl transferase family 2
MTGAATSMRGAFGRRSKRVERTPTSAMEGSMSVGFEPVRLLELELADFRRRSFGRVEDARLPIRPGARSPHGTPLGVLDTDGHGSETAPEALAERARRKFGAAIDAHVMDDCLAHTSPGSEAPAGSLGVPRCVRERLGFSARAPFASIVIATRERPDGLAATLDTVLALEYPRFEIIVVDNANTTDRTRSLLELHYADVPNLSYVREPLPGLAVVHNRGLTMARGEIVAFTDDDVVVDSLWLVELARAFEFADDVACVTGLILPMELETPAQFWLENSIRYNKGYAGGASTSGLHVATACRRSQRPRGLCPRWRTRNSVRPSTARPVVGASRW